MAGDGSELNKTLERVIHEWLALCACGDVSMTPAMEEKLKRDFKECYYAGEGTVILKHELARIEKLEKSLTKEEL